jgi:hypothetical protein
LAGKNAAHEERYGPWQDDGEQVGDDVPCGRMSQSGDKTNQNKQNRMEQKKNRQQDKAKNGGNLTADFLLEQIVPVQRVAHFIKQKMARKNWGNLYCIKCEGAYRMMMLNMGIVVMIAARGKMYVMTLVNT